MQVPSHGRAGRRAQVLLLLLPLLAACSDLGLAPEADDAARDAKATSGGVIQVWWPTDGAWLEGVQPFKALLEGRSLSEYDMFWQVDGGSWNWMADSWQDAPHKEAQVDVSSWTWRGAGPYAVNFIAREKKGKKRILAQREVKVYVGDAPTTTPPAESANPFANETFYIDPYSNARRTADEWQATRPADALEMEKIASRPQADWFGEWSGDIGSAVSQRVSTIAAAGALPVLVAYMIPGRDCNGYSAGGSSSADAYRAWIRDFAAGIGSRKAVVVLEPDALAALDCLPQADQDLRMQLLYEAVQTLKAQPAVAVYIDAGHARWKTADVMAERLRRAGIAYADGFSLNVSNFIGNADSKVYGEAISAHLGGTTRFIIDSSRNGLGPTADGQWCNPDGRALGTNPTAATNHPLVDAFFWIKRPGESDGTCNGGPSAGAWWADYALGLAQRQTELIAAATSVAPAGG